MGPELSKIYKRFALMIEAYCRGNYTHLNSMLRQVDMVARLTNLSKVVKTVKDKEGATKVCLQRHSLLYGASSAPSWIKLSIFFSVNYICS